MYRDLGEFGRRSPFRILGGFPLPAGPLTGCEPVLRVSVEDKRVNEGDYALISARNG